MRTLPSISSAISSSVGATMRQGPHQEAQKSTRTGTLDCSTSLSKLSWLTLTTLSLAIGIDSPFSLLSIRCGQARHRPYQQRTPGENAGRLVAASLLQLRLPGRRLRLHGLRLALFRMTGEEVARG